MRLTEQIQVRASVELSKLCHLAKNLYNSANWYYRQDFFKLDNFLNYFDLDFILKHKEVYRNLPAQTSQQILKLIIKNWRSYFRATKEYKRDYTKFRKRPRIPGYKKKNGESIIIFTNQQCKIRNGYLHFPEKVSLKPIKTRIKDDLHQIRIIPRGNRYIIEIIYEREIKNLNLNKNRVIGIDLGINNLVTIVNNAGLKPFVIKGSVVKSMNQFYNKRKARLSSIKDKQGYNFETGQIKHLTLRRNNKIKDFFHKTSRKIIEYCIENNLGTIITGYNEGWKQEVNIGKKNNQNFVNIPFLELIQKIRYKSELVGIDVKMDGEGYTSKCSFLDAEKIEKHSKYSGKRISRGLFKTSNGTIINADVNAGYNIIKKAVPKAFTADGIEGVGLHPYCINI